VADNATKFKADPSQIGELEVTEGVAGELGSTKLIGPTGSDAQVFNATLILLYAPADKFGMVTTPPALEVMDTD
jgi:hypothetical protein